MSLDTFQHGVVCKAVLRHADMLPTAAGLKMAVAFAGNSTAIQEMFKRRIGS